MLLRRLFHSSRHLRHGLQTLTTTTTATAASSSPLSAPLLFRRLPTALTSRLLSPRLLSTVGRDDDTNKPWAFTTESGDPDPFANEDTDAAATTGEVPLGSSAAVEDPWAKGFRAEDGEKGDVFEEIYKEGDMFAVWGGLFSTFDCTMVFLRQKEDPWNSIIAGAATGGFLSMRQGAGAAGRAALMGGALLALIEGAGLMLNRVLATPQNLPPLPADDPNLAAAMGGDIPGLPQAPVSPNSPSPRHRLP